MSRLDGRESTMRIEHTCLSAALGLALFGAPSARATDYWDASAINDDTALSTFNEMAHGVSQQHDLQPNVGAMADEDWSFLFNSPYSSYEVVVDSASADVAPLQLTRMGADGTTVLQQAEAFNVGAPVSTNRALRWENAFPTAFALNHLRVRSGGCTTTCGAANQYHIRFYETTIAVPRFNNAGGQVTVLIVQNATSWNRNIDGMIHFWNTAGTELTIDTFSLPARATRVLNTATIPGAAGASGTITITHNGGYGGLAVKSVALDPATGFSFDTPGSYKPQ
jgi:hypothetical protein